jgi:hypothetical protein
VKETKVLVVTVDEVKAQLVEHFVNLLSDREEARAWLREGRELPNIDRMTESQLAVLAQEGDLFRSDQDDCRMVVMQSHEDPLRFFRVSASERDAEPGDKDEPEYGTCRRCGEPLDTLGYCVDPNCFYNEYEQNQKEPGDIVEDAIKGLKDLYPELQDPAYADAIARKVEVPHTGDDQADYQNVRDQVERLIEEDS